MVIQGINAPNPVIAQRIAEFAVAHDCYYDPERGWCSSDMVDTIKKFGTRNPVIAVMIDGQRVELRR